MYTILKREETSPTLNNQTVKGRNLGEKLFRRGGRNGLDDYKPIDSVNISNEKPVDLYPNNFSNNIDFETEYNSGYIPEDPQLILDTQEIRDEVIRNDYIYAGEDVSNNNANANTTIGSVQKRLFGH